VLVTLVIRLVPEGLAAGRFVGQVEHVGNGDQELVCELSDLLGFAQRAAAADGRPPAVQAEDDNSRDQEARTP
jgi:hypothetical protein